MRLFRVLRTLTLENSTMKFKTTCLLGTLIMMASSIQSLYAGDGVNMAICVVQPTEGNKCHGTVHFEDIGGGKVKVTSKISGLEPSRKHAIHIHEFGDVTDLSGKRRRWPLQSRRATSRASACRKAPRWRFGQSYGQRRR